MTDPKYDIHISYVPPATVGLIGVYIDGLGETQSVPYQSSEYYVATMNLAKIWATGSSYTDALDNLLLIATASTTLDPNILPFKRTW